MIPHNSVFKIGYIARQRGLRGEVELAFTDDCFDTGTAEYLVLDMDGILVPFFWEEYRFKNNDTAIVKFEYTDNEDQAKRLVGHEVYYPKDGIAETAENEEATLSSYKALTGFTISNAKDEPIGIVEYVDDSSANILLTINRNDGGEMMIPFHNDFLLGFDLRQRTLRLDIPEELFELNS